MIQSAVADVVAPTVTAKDPLAARYKNICVLYKFLAMRAVALFNKRSNLLCKLLGYLNIVLVGNPLLEELLKLV